MPPILALALTLGFIGFLLHRDSRQAPASSAALWLPVSWFALSASRFASGWLAILGIPVGSSSSAEGSPIDAIVFLFLILAGCVVLARRRIDLPAFLRNNVALSVFFVFCFLAIAWSDYPFVAFKRWIKVLGHPVMALIILTDPHPVAAFTRMMKRTGYLLVPFSVLFIKYFPEIGRGFDAWSGDAMNRGVCLSKNELGFVSLTFALIYAWALIRARSLPRSRLRRDELVLNGVLLALSLWLLRMSGSATSLACFSLGLIALMVYGWTWVRRYIGGWQLLVLTLLVLLIESVFGLYKTTVEMMGRDATLTDRTEVWQDVIELTPNPVIGAGFESFWLGERQDRMNAKWWWRPTQAHNGYIETYINLGFMGLAFLVGCIASSFAVIRRSLQTDPHFGRIRMAFLLVILIYNFTEATFKTVHPLWTVFYIISMWYPTRAVHARSSPEFMSASSPSSRLAPQRA